MCFFCVDVKCVKQGRASGFSTCFYLTVCCELGIAAGSVFRCSRYRQPYHFVFVFLNDDICFICMRFTGALWYCAARSSAKSVQVRFAQYKLVHVYACIGLVH